MRDDLARGASETPVTTAQLQDYVRFQLSQLRARNQHHKFEDICRAFSRQYIATNILPATGPVSAGGDQGRDFETFRTYLQTNSSTATSYFSGTARGETLAFACTLQLGNVRSKVKSDITNITASGAPVSTIYYFTEQNIEVALRHELIEWARSAKDVSLEVLDGQALAENLATKDGFWICYDYLNVPVNLMPPDNSDVPDWYAADKHRWMTRIDAPYSLGDFIDLSGCIRFSSNNIEFVGDLEFWIAKLETLAGTSSEKMLQDCRLEIVIARLKGHLNVRPAEDHVLRYFDDAVRAPSARSLDGATTLLTYVISAFIWGATDLALDYVLETRAKLTDLAEDMLTHESDAGSRCVILDTLATLKSSVDLQAMLPPNTQHLDTPSEVSAEAILEMLSNTEDVRDLRLREGLRILDPDGAVSAWLDMLSVADQAPLFPITPVADRLALLAPLLVDALQWQQLTEELDMRVAERAGSAAAAQRAWSRARSLQQADRPLAALHELQRARIGWMRSDTKRQALDALLATAACFEDLGLFYAAKHYALAAGALAGEIAADTEIAAHALLRCCAIDYRAGNWASMYGLLPLAISIHQETRPDPTNLDTWTDAGHAIKVALVARFLAKEVTALAAVRMADRCIVQAIGSSDQSLDELQNPLPDLTAPEVIEYLATELGQPMFADSGVDRRIEWQMWGTRWRLRCENTYSDVQAAERLAAGIQTLLASLSEDELVLMPAFVDVEVSTDIHLADPRVCSVPEEDDATVCWQVTLTRDQGPHSVDIDRASRELFVTVMTIVASISLLKPHRFRDALKNAAERGILTQLTPHIRYDRAYAVLSEADFDASSRREISPVGERLHGTPTLHESLFPITAPGPGYSSDEGRLRASNRYASFENTLRHTLPYLKSVPGMANRISELRGRGWKDWHILQSIFNIAANYRLNLLPEMDDDSIQAYVRRLMRDPEESGAPLPPPDRFTLEQLDEALLFSVGGTVRTWDLDLPQGRIRPKLWRAVLAARYGYWTDDADHEDPFQ